MHDATDNSDTKPELTPPKRDGKGRFKPGTSGNPKGRTPGSGVVLTVRQEMRANLRGLCGVVWKQAMAGDIGAARVILDRIMPALKATDEAVAFDLPDDDMVVQARSVLKAMAEGSITPDQAGQVLGSMASVAKVIEVHELERRLLAVEAQVGVTHA